ncbi:cytochrome b/b6 domain-containing protein [Rhodopseudomonas boonkerdii]|uniref:cytochrome b/b6 domain-containing protein n=1 Tax=Rhodopseudomonas boonkerdii TaxID=475937 RepID=UPI001E485BA0|nr:cytochrome b/b6 domain-containing protein [Rhodopseudomonas boonkerdii]UGV24316.1 cytochrome b/b6 domain-containing protein [Rhodopseudomonas boonkerdii]
MSSISIDDAQNASATSKAIQPVWVRVLHWINAVAMVIMIMSGWQIYNASPLFDFVFPRSITLGGWLGGGIMWHLAGMWLLVINGLLYVLLGIVTGRFRRRLLPISTSGVIGDTRAALTGKLSHADLSTYNQVQRLLYIGILIVGVVIVLSGLAIWKPVQFQYLTAIFGGYDTARYVHFVMMASIVGFLVIHVALALIVPKSLRAMIIGR